MNDLQRVMLFRNRLIEHVNVVSHVRSNANPTKRATAKVYEEQPGLAQEYGRLHRVINRYGISSLTNNFGVISRDVIQDAIHKPDHPYYEDVARGTQQHLDTTIGRLEAEATGWQPDDIYRLTSPVFWLVQLALGMRGLLATLRGRVIATVGAILIALVAAIVNGWAQAFFTKLMGGP
jgi:hypothetical protein